MPLTTATPSRPLRSEPDLDLALDRLTALIVARECAGHEQGWGCPAFYRAQAAIFIHRAQIVAGWVARRGRSTRKDGSADYADALERLCEHAVRAAQANAICIAAKDTPGETRAWANLLAAERALVHAKCELSTTLEQLRELAEGTPAPDSCHFPASGEPCGHCPACAEAAMGHADHVRGALKDGGAR